MQRYLLSALLIGCLAPCWGGAEADELYARGVEAEALQRPREALESFRAADRLRPDNPRILQKIARQLSDLTFIERDQAKREELTREALGYAERAYALDSNSPEIVLSMAILYGKLGTFAGVGDKVRYARKVRQYAEEALVLDPDYAWAHHVMGQWHYSVAELGSTSRFFVSLLFGGLPEASAIEGVRHLERAVELSPDEVVHRVELGFAYAHAERESEAREQWQVALELPERGLEDGPAIERAREALRAADGLRVALQSARQSRS